MAREVTLVDAGLGNIASVERALVQVGAAVRISSDPDQVARARMVVFPGQSAFGAATRAIVDGAMGAALRMVIERGDPFLGICLGMQLLFDGSDENGGQEGLHVLPGWCRRFPDGMLVRAEPGAEEKPEAPAPAEPQADLEHAQSVAPAANVAGLGGAIAATGTGSGWASSGSTAPAASSTDPSTGTAEAAEGIAAVTESVPAATAPPQPERARTDDDKLYRRLKVPHMGWNDVEPTGDHYYFVHSYYVEPEKTEDVMWMATYGGIRFPAAVRRNNVLGCQFHPEKSQRAGLKFLRAFLLGGWGA